MSLGSRPMNVRPVRSAPRTPPGGGGGSGSQSPGSLNTTTSPRLVPDIVVVIFEATMRSLMRSVSSIDALGTKKACTRKARTSAERTSADTMMIAVSPNQRPAPLRCGRGPRPLACRARPSGGSGSGPCGSRAETAIRNRSCGAGHGGERHRGSRSTADGTAATARPWRVRRPSTRARSHLRDPPCAHASPPSSSGDRPSPTACPAARPHRRFACSARRRGTGTPISSRGTPLTVMRPSASQHVTRSPPTPMTRLMKSVESGGTSPIDCPAHASTAATGLRSGASPAGTNESDPSNTTTSPRSMSRRW